jgi:hypothetical protein
MTLQEYLHKFPLQRGMYPRSDVQKIRVHAFQKASERPGSISDKQRRYYFGVVIKILRMEIGYAPEEMHQELGELFRTYEAHGRKFIRSITDYSTTEMEEYLSTVRQFAATELRTFIPKPNETEFAYTIKESKNGKNNDRSGVQPPEKQDSTHRAVQPVS